MGSLDIDYPRSVEKGGNGVYRTIENYRSAIPEGVSGDWRVEKFEVSKEDAMFERLMAIVSSSHGRGVPEGIYTRLKRNGTLVMSDTPDELMDGLSFYWNAKGHVLINGLGLGCTVDLVFAVPAVEKVTVIEISPDVIALVGPHLRYGDRLEIVEADAFTYQPPRGIHYGAVWHDIWDYITSDNLPEMHKLHRKYGRRADWQGSWCRDRCER